MSQEKTPAVTGFDAYREQVNINLFNDIIAFIADTTALDVVPTRRKLSAGHLWYSRSDSDSIQAQYGFRYFGELLERYEDKAGSDIRDIRAIALAMGYTKDLFTDDMFVGKQKTGFIRKITALSPGDIYLKGALYLLNRYEPIGDAIFEELTKAVYTQTKELVFAASLLDEFEQVLKYFKPQLLSLLGSERTMPVFGNIGVYAWLLRALCAYHKSKGIRGKDMGLLRALIELPVSFVKTGNKYNKALRDNGYNGCYFARKI